MKPIVFKEQLKLEKNTLSHKSRLSLVEYKIDYDNELGDGIFGRVYGVLERPENEKNFLSFWFPYQYDYWFRLDHSEKKETKWCVKITKDYYLDRGPDIKTIFLEKSSQYRSNQLLRKYRVTNVVFPETYGYRAQFKSLVKGKTLDYYLFNKHFEDPKYYPLRKAYVSFIWSIKSVPLMIDDLHLRNIMYDEESQQIEIVDSYAVELDKSVNDHPIEERGILHVLQHVAREGIRYSEQFDRYLLSERKKVAEFHDITDLEKYPEQLVPYSWKLKGKNIINEGKSFNFFKDGKISRKLSAEEKVDHIIHGTFPRNL